MKNGTSFTNRLLRWCALIALFALATTNAMATTYTVAGSDATFLGASWNTSYTSNDMSQYGSTTYYYLIKTGKFSDATDKGQKFKVALDHAWTTSYPSENYEFTAPNTTTSYTMVYIFNTNGNSVSVTGPFSSLTVAGDDTQALSTSWTPSTTSNDMSSDDGITYTLTKQVTYTASGSYACKVATNHSWTTAYPSSDYPYSIPAAGTYNVTYTFNVITQALTIDVAEVVEESDYTLTWNGMRYTMKAGDDGNYTYTLSDVELTAGMEYAFTATDGSHYPGGSVTPETTGKYTITFTYDVTNNTITAALSDLVEPYSYTFYVRTTGSSKLYLYAWDSSGTQLLDNWPGTAGSTTETINGYTYYKFTVTTYDETISVIANNASKQTNDLKTTAGTYTYYITFNPSSTGSSALNTEPDADTDAEDHEYTFYVRTTDSSTPNLYAWNTSDDSEKPFGSWSGTAGSTTETINGYTYYKFTCTTTASQLGCHR